MASPFAKGAKYCEQEKVTMNLMLCFSFAPPSVCVNVAAALDKGDNVRGLSGYSGLVSFEMPS